MISRKLTIRLEQRKPKSSKNPIVSKLVTSTDRGSIIMASKDEEWPSLDAVEAVTSIPSTANHQKPSHNSTKISSHFQPSLYTDLVSMTEDYGNGDNDPGFSRFQSSGGMVSKCPIVILKRSKDLKNACNTIQSEETTDSNSSHSTVNSSLCESSCKLGTTSDAKQTSIGLSFEERERLYYAARDEIFGKM